MTKGTNAHPHRTVSRRRLWLFRLVALVGGPLLFLGAVECLLRVCGFGYPTSYFVPIAGQSFLTTNDRFAYLFFPPSLVRSPVGERIPAQKGERTWRIVLVGGSAARGTPDAAYSPGRFLRALLKHRFPGVRFEVINAAMTAINSHVVAQIVADAVALKPDAFVVYCGNNEVVGPYGPGTVFQGFCPSTGVIRASIALRKLKLSQFLAWCARAVGAARQGGGEWTGLALFEKHKVPPWDSRLKQVYRAFGENLRAICKEASASGAVTFLCTVPVNLRDCAPFASVHKPALSGEELAAWQKHYQAAIHLAQQGRTAQAEAAFKKALQIDDAFGELHFRLAEVLAARGEHEAAARHYQKARDWDALRFRADSELNRIVREVASEGGRRVVLVPEVKAFGEAPETKYGCPGKELFYEHVHLNIPGRYRFALTCARSMLPHLPEWIRMRDRGKWPGLSECREALLLTPAAELSMAEEMLDMINAPPFSQQLHHRENVEALRATIARLRRTAGTREALQRECEALKRRCGADPGDVFLKQKLAEALARAGRYKEAAEVLGGLLREIPGVASWYVALGRFSLQAGKRKQAITAFNKAISLRPLSPDAYRAYLELGDCALSGGDARRACRLFRKALEVCPGSCLAEARLGAAYVERGELAKAEAAFRRAIAARPTYAEAYFNLAAVVVKRGEVGETEKLLRKAISLKDDFAEAYHALGKLYLKQGFAGKALPYLQRAAALNPSLPGVRTDLQSARSRSGSR